MQESQSQSVREQRDSFRVARIPTKAKKHAKPPATIGDPSLATKGRAQS